MRGLTQSSFRNPLVGVGQCQIEAGALDRVGKTNLAAMVLGNLADDRQAQAATIRAAFDGAMEPFENPLTLSVGDARSLIANHEPGVIGLVGNPNLQLSTIGAAIAKRIVDQIVERLREHDPVAVDRRRLPFGVEGYCHTTP